MSDGVTEGNLDNHTDTQVNTTGDVDPVVGVSKHDQAMIQKADAGLNLSPTNTGNDPLLAGKYKDEAALNKGVTELLKMQHPDMSVEEIYKGIETGKLVPSSTASATDSAGDKGTGGDTKTDAERAAEKVAQESELGTLDPVALSLERDENDGQLTPETRDKIINEYKIDETTLNTYLAGLNALEEQFVGKVYEITGGEESYQAMLGWMNESLTQEDRDAFNEQLSTQDINKVKVAVDGMNARYKAVVGDNPANLLRPDNSQDVITGGGYSSKAEWMADMKNPQYNTDPAFREKVIAKLAKSPGI